MRATATTADGFRGSVGANRKPTKRVTMVAGEGKRRPVDVKKGEGDGGGDSLTRATGDGEISGGCGV